MRPRTSETVAAKLLRKKRRRSSSSTRVNSSSNWSTSSSISPPPSGKMRLTARASPRSFSLKLWQEGRWGIYGHMEQGSLQLFQRVCSRNHLGNQPIFEIPAARRAVRRESGPAFTTLDLPLPLGPTRAKKRFSSRWTNSWAIRS